MTIIRLHRADNGNPFLFNTETALTIHRSSQWNDAAQSSIGVSRIRQLRFDSAEIVVVETLEKIESLINGAAS